MGILTWYKFLETVILAVLILFLTIIVYSDFKINRIPNICLTGVMLCSLTAGVLLFNLSYAERLAGFFLVSVPMLGSALIWPGVFGGGDIKLAAFGGAYLGVVGIVRAFSTGILLAGFYIIIIFALGKKKRKIPLGPFLSTGIVIEAFRLLFL